MFLTEKDCRYMAGHCLIVGLSGGADSMSLVHFLAVNRPVYGWEVRAVHLNHCLRGEESLRDEQAVRTFCREMGISLSICREDVGAMAREKGLSLEDAGREARYAFFEKEAHLSLEEGLSPLILTAHTLSDDLETALYRLVRGSGLDGLCGIERERKLGPFTVFRPMLGISRAEVENYCQLYDIPFVTDSSNLSTDYARNRLRLEVVPQLKAINPSVERAYGRLKESLTVDRDYLNREAETLLRGAEISSDCWRLEPLQEAPEPLKRRAEREILRRSDIGLTAQHIAALDAVICGETRGFSAGGKRFVCRGGELRLEEEAVYRAPEIPLPFLEPGDERWLAFSIQKAALGGQSINILQKTVHLRLSGCVTLEKTLKVYKNLLYSGIDYATIMNNVVLRTRRPGDSIRLPGYGGRKTLKKLFQQAHLSREDRETRVMLAAGSDIVWLEGFGTGEDFLPRGGGAVLQIQAEGRDRKDETSDE